MKTPIAYVILIVLSIGLVAGAQDPAVNASLVAASAPQVAAANRPPEVPKEYVITPFGYFHPSCVRQVAEGETVLGDGRVQHPDGSVEAAAPACDYPRYSPQGALVTSDNTEDGGKTPATNGWVETISAITNTSYGALAAIWITPPPPATNDGQTVFLFPGMEDINDVQSIVQPVLQWGGSGAGGGNYWAIASWNCCISGTAYNSNLINVNPGDLILGTITSTCASGENSCPAWNVKTEDLNTRGKTILSKTPSEGQEWNWAFGATLEVYNVIQCADYPTGNGVTFNVRMYDENLEWISNPGWTGITPPGITPSCAFGVNSEEVRETVEYNLAPKIISVSRIDTQQWQTIVIKGTGFGQQQPYTGDSAHITLWDLTRNWAAGYAGPCFRGNCDDAVGLMVISWTDSEIVLGGFPGAWGLGSYTLDKGDLEQIYVWNAQSGSGPASLKTIVQ
jgi:hypothetical protein